VIAKQAANFASLMVVVNTKISIFRLVSARPTAAIKPIEQLVVLLFGDPVLLQLRRKFVSWIIAFMRISLTPANLLQILLQFPVVSIFLYLSSTWFAIAIETIRGRTIAMKIRAASRFTTP
jgi:hypothetical protein